MEQLELASSTNTKNIDEAIFKIQNEAPVITKDGVNPHFKSKYAEYHEIQKAVKDLLFREKILVSFMPIVGNKLIMFVKQISTTEFYKVTADLNSLQASPQAQGSAITYLKRYMFTAVFNLIIQDASDDDGNGASLPKAAETKPAQPATTQAATTANPPVDRKTLPFLNPDTEKWIDVKIWYFAKDKPLAKVTAKYQITAKNQTLLGERELLKPGTKLWTAATKYLTKNDATIAGIGSCFDVSDQDLQDLQVDALNLQAATEAKTNEQNK